jgi:hypothetical protein
LPLPSRTSPASRLIVASGMPEARNFTQLPSHSTSQVVYTRRPLSSRRTSPASSPARSYSRSACTLNPVRLATSPIRRTSAVTGES